MAALPAAIAQGLAPCAQPLGRIVSVQGAADVSRAAAAPVAVAADTPLCAGDHLVVRSRGRVAVLLNNQTVMRLDEGASLTLTEAGEPGGLQVEGLRGRLHVISRTPRRFRVTTPFLNASVDGTEFHVAATSSSSAVQVFEGVVTASNDAGSVRVSSGEQAVALARDAAPSRQLVVRPADAVAWTLHVPTVAGYDPGRAQLSGPAESIRRRVAEALQRGRPDLALDMLASVPSESIAPLVHIERAGLLLRLGRIDEARQELATLRRLAPGSSDGRALESVIALVENDRDRATALAGEAVTLDPSAPAARIAMSYALQARFEIEAARDSVEVAVGYAPRHALAWARLAELELALGELDDALGAANRSVALDSGEAKAHMVLGFAHLVRVDLGPAELAFDKSIGLDPSDPLPWLGRGLTKIRRGGLTAGREDIEVAAALDPLNSTTRSYLGKAYYEEKRPALDATQFALAKERDPLDPTPHYYDAIRKHSENRPIEALEDLATSTRLNDNRAVYRSRLLLDEDAAARGAHQARVYTDLGFEQLAVSEAVKSMAKDASNHGAHGFLAEYYTLLPRHEMARDSELLQAQLLQPLGLGSIQPRLAGSGLSSAEYASFARPGAAEYSRLLDASSIRFYADTSAGSRGNYSSALVLSGLGETASFSIGHFALGNDGYRVNNDQRVEVANALLQVSNSSHTSAQVELRRTAKSMGDTALSFFDEANFEPTVRNDFRSDSVRMGMRHDLSPRSTLIANYIHREQADQLHFPAFNARFDTDERADLLELRHLSRGRASSSTLGVGILTGRQVDVEIFGSDPPGESQSRLKHLNAYAYPTWHVGRSLDLTAGLAWDRYKDIRTSRAQWSPKLGLLWSPSERVTVRLAAFRALKRRVVLGQTIEPSGIFGFNQYYSGITDLNGSDAKTVGAALDYRLSGALALAAECSAREQALLAAQVGAPRDLTVQESQWKIRLYWSVSNRMAVSSGLQTQFIRAPDEGLNPALLLRSRTVVLPFEVRLFDASGFYARLRMTGLRQEGTFFDFASGAYRPGRSTGTFVDAALGLRLPRRLGFVSVEALNLTDSRSRVQEINPQSAEIARRRVVMVRAGIAL